jgi:hypothetical protein
MIRTGIGSYSARIQLTAPKLLSWVWANGTYAPNSDGGTGTPPAIKKPDSFAKYRCDRIYASGAQAIPLRAACRRRDRIFVRHAVFSLTVLPCSKYCDLRASGSDDCTASVASGNVPAPQLFLFLVINERLEGHEVWRDICG